MEVIGQLQVTFGQAVEWAPDLVWTTWRGERSLALAGNQTPDRPYIVYDYIYLNTDTRG